MSSVGQDTEGLCLWETRAFAGVVIDVDFLCVALATWVCECADLEGESAAAEAEEGEDASELHFCGGVDIGVIEVDMIF